MSAKGSYEPPTVEWTSVINEEAHSRGGVHRIEPAREPPNPPVIYKLKGRSLASRGASIFAPEQPSENGQAGGAGYYDSEKESLHSRHGEFLCVKRLLARCSAEISLLWWTLRWPRDPDVA
jgi:hypothetical protein